MRSSLFSRLLIRAEVLSAFQYREFRIFWLGLLVSVTGFQILIVTQSWLIYELTGQAKYLGILGLVTAIPTIILNLVGGVVADRLDQRRLVAVTQSLSAVLVGILGMLTWFDIVQVWHILVIAFISGGVLAFDNPARLSLYPHLIDRKHLMNAVALNTSIWQGTRIIGPAIGGLLIAKFGTASGFLAAGIGFCGMVFALLLIKFPNIERGGRGSMLKNMGEGVQFVLNNRLFLGLMGMMFFNCYFGLSYMFLLPVFAEDILKVHADGLGYLHAASGLGALLMTFIATSLGNTRWKGLLLITGATTFGLCLVLFAAASHFLESFGLSLGLLFVSGAGTSLYMIMVMTTLQSQVPDDLRGRVMGIQGVTWSLIPLGAVHAGFLSDLVNAPFAVGVGGFATMLFAIVIFTFNSQVRSLGSEFIPARGRNLN